MFLLNRMSFIPCVTLANLTTPVTSIGGGGVPPYNGSNIPNLVVSSLTANSFINTNVFNASTINSATNNTSTLNTSTINVSYLDLDGQVLTANATELLLNGVPLATTSNISSLADWSLYPVLPSGLNGGNAAMSNIQSIQSFSGSFQSLMTNVLTVNTLVAQSTIQSLSTISTLELIADIGNITSMNTSTLNAYDVFATIGNISTLNAYDVFATTGNISTLNAVDVFATTGSISTFNTQAINMKDRDGGGVPYISYETLGTILLPENVSTLTGSVISSLACADGGDNGVSFACNPLYIVCANDGNGMASKPAFSLSNAGSNLVCDGEFKSPSLTLGAISTGVLTVDLSNNLTFNGAIITAGGGASSNWSQFPATQTVNMNTQALSNAGAITGASLACSGNVSGATIGSSGTITATGAITGDTINGSNGVFGSFASIQGNAGSGSVTTGSVTSSGLINCQNGFNGTGNFSFTGNLGESVVLSTDANATGIRLQLGAMLLTCPAAFSLNAGGAGNLAAGGAISIAAGDYIDMNAGTVNIIGGSILNVNTINTSNVTSLVSVATPTLNVNTITNPTNTPVSVNQIMNVSQLASVTSINSVPITSILPNPPTYQIYVSKNGSDTIGTGSIMQPFLTIAKALTTASAFSDTNIVTILLTPGNFAENVTVTRNNTFINGLSTNSQEASITGAVSFTVNTQTVGFISAGIVGITINGSLSFSSTATVPVAFSAISGVINGISGSIPLTLTTTSTTGNFNFSSQFMVIIPIDTIAISVTNVRASFVFDNIRGPTTLLQTFGNSSFTIFGSQLTNTNATATAPPIIRLSNTSPALGIIGIANSYLAYTSATVDTGLNKCCIQLSTTAGATATVNITYTLLICEGARVTNGTAGQYLCVQNPGAGVITMPLGLNTAGNTAFRVPNASAKFSKSQYPGVV